MAEANYSNPQVTFIKDENGNTVDTTAPSDETAKAYKTGRTLYKNDEGNWSTQPQSSVKLNAGGGITVTAPKSYLEDKELLGNILDENSMKYLSRLYKANSDAKVTLSDGTETKVTDLVSSYNKAVQDVDRAVQGMTTMQEGLIAQGKTDLANQLNLRLYQITGINGLGVDKDDKALLAFPKAVLSDKRWSFLKDFDSYNAENGTVYAKEFIDKYYHLDTGRDFFSGIDDGIGDGIYDLKKKVSDLLNRTGAGDPEEWARTQALATFLQKRNAEGDFWNSLSSGALGVGEGVARATAIVVPSFLNGVWNIVAWLASYTNPALLLTGKSGAAFQILSNPIDNLANWLGEISGLGTLVDSDTTFEQIMSDQFSERTAFYQATNAEIGGLFTMAYIGANVAEGMALGKAQGQVMTNVISLLAAEKFLPLAIENASRLATGVEKVAEKIGEPASPGFSLGLGEATPVSLEALRNMSGSEAAVSLLTGVENPTWRDTLRVLFTMDAGQIVTGAMAIQGQIGALGAAVKGAAMDQIAQYGQWYIDSIDKLDPTHVFDYFMGHAGLFTQYQNYTKNWRAIAASADTLYQSALETSRAVSTMSKISNAIPWMVLASEAIVGAATKNPEAIRGILSGNASDEDKQYFLQQLGQNLTAYTASLLLGKFLGMFRESKAGEQLNAYLSRKMGSVEEFVANTRDEMKVKLLGEGWMDNISNPQKQLITKLNKIGNMAQSNLAHAADGLKGAEAVAATERAKQIVMNISNATTDFQAGVKRQLDLYNSDAYPAFNAANANLTGVMGEYAKLLDKHNIPTSTEPTAMIYGYPTNTGVPQDLVNYTARTLSRGIILNRMSGDIKNLEFLPPEYQKEWAVDNEVIETVENAYPAEITDYVKSKLVPALKETAYQMNQIDIKEGRGRVARQEGLVETGFFGEDGKDWVPLQRITDAQKNYEEDLRQFSKTESIGAIARNNTERVLHYKPGSESMEDFVDPALVLQIRLQHIAHNAQINNLNAAYKDLPNGQWIVKANGEETDAVHTYEELKPSFKKGMQEAIKGMRERSETESLLNSFFDQRRLAQSAKKVDQQVARAQDRLEKAEARKDIPVKKSETLAMVDSLTGEELQGYLGDQSAQLLTGGDTWDKFWKEASPKQRQAVRNGVESTAPLTGFGLDKRAWLNEQVPGFDVLDWGLLGRMHTNGLVPGGMYSEYDGMPVRAFIMDLEALEGLTRYDQHPYLGDASRITQDFNIQGGVGAVLPLHISSDGELYLQSRWGHSGDNPSAWAKYLDNLRNQGVTKVPVAVAAYSDDHPTDVATWDKIRNTGAQDITADLQEAFTDRGTIPFFRGQTGLGDFQMNDRTGTGAVGNAYWIAPNASYTDVYGPDKIAGQIPMKSFMASAEKDTIAKDIRRESRDLARALPSDLEKRVSTLKDEFAKLRHIDPQNYKEDGDVLARRDLARSIDNAVRAASMPKNRKGMYEYGEEYTKKEVELAKDIDACDWAEYRLDGGYERLLPTKAEDSAAELGEPRIADIKDPELRERLYQLARLQDIVGPEGNNGKPEIRSYRGLAEYAGKPVIDISEDGFASGTAFFYYKGVDPKFDEAIGKQLETQSAGTTPTFDDELVDDLIDKLDQEVGIKDLIEVASRHDHQISNSYQDLIESMEMGIEGDGPDAENAYWDDIVNKAKKATPGIAEVLDRIYYPHPANADSTVYSDRTPEGLTDFLYDPKSTSWVVNGKDAIAFLQEITETGKFPEIRELFPASPSQEKIDKWDKIDPRSPNYPVGQIPKSAPPYPEGQFTEAEKNFGRDAMEALWNADPSMLGGPKLKKPSIDYDAFAKAVAKKPEILDNLNRETLKKIVRKNCV